MDWVFEPHVGVGPLRFGMTPTDASLVLNNGAARSLHKDPLTGQYFYSDIVESGVRIYYSSDRLLACVAISPSGGQQVFCDEIATVRRVPSDLNRDLVDYAKCHGLECRVNIAGDVFLWELGLYFGVERSGDSLLSRPRFMIEEWSEDAEEMPKAEWRY